MTSSPRSLPSPAAPSGRSTAARSRSATTSSRRRRSRPPCGRPSPGAFAGDLPHTVTVANAPRGFSSLYLGRTSGSYSLTPQVPGTYGLVFLVYPTSMAQTLQGR
jgi:hypothetical protein